MERARTSARRVRRLRAQADKYGFLLVCPSAVSSDGCWDVHSSAVLTHNGGGDASGIISMVNYVVQNRNGDASRVFVTGHSSGGMMTNVLLGVYPDVFKAGAAFAGVPFACFAQGSVDGSGWNSSCANGQREQDRSAVGRPRARRLSRLHAARDRACSCGTEPPTRRSTSTTSAKRSKQWTNVLGVSETPATTENNAIQSSWIRTRYVGGSGVVEVEAIQETGQPHNLVVDLANAIHFFGLDGSMPVPDGGAGGSGGSTGVDGGVDAGGGGRGGAGGRGGVAGGAAGDGGRGDGAGAAGTSATAGSAGTSTGGAAGGGRGEPPGARARAEEPPEHRQAAAAAAGWVEPPACPRGAATPERARAAPPRLGEQAEHGVATRERPPARPASPGTPAPSGPTPRVAAATRSALWIATG